MRSVPAGSFERLTSPLALWRAWLSYASGKQRRPAVAAFSLDADTHVMRLHRALDSGRYRPGPYQLQVIRDPKVRLIAAPAMADRVVHQAIVAELAPHYARSYIHGSYACLAGRGPQRAVLRYLGWSRRWRWRLSLDVQRYFPSIDHQRLLAILARRLRDHRTRALLSLLIGHGGAVYRTPLAIETLGVAPDPARPGAGLPIGSCLSQWCANLYLDGLDHFVVRELRAPAYLRYMDDFTLFGDDAGFLVEARARIAGWLEAERRLVLKPRRWAIVPAGQPSTYLGYRVSRAGLVPGRKMRRRMRQKVQLAASRGPDALRATLESYRALALFG